MKVYLVQHGEAKPETENPQRPLTDKGKEEVKLVARQVATLGIKVSEIFHSDKLRAKETAEILAQFLSPSGSIKEIKGLAPLDEPGIAKSIIDEAQEPLMIVGHLPHLSRLTSLLILGDPQKEIITFRMGGIVCLSKTDTGWTINWILTPDLLQAKEKIERSNL